MKRLLKFLCLVSVLAFVALAQNAVYQLPISVGPPAPPSNISVQTSGTQGNTYYCYYVVAQYSVGSVYAGPACTYLANSTLSGSNYDIVSWSAPGAGSPTYAVLRCAPTSFGGTCTFPGTATDAVTTSTSSTSVNDQSNSLSSYTFTNAPPATFTLSVNNRDFSQPAVTIQDNNGNTAFRVTQSANGNGTVTANIGQFNTAQPFTEFATPPPYLVGNITSTTDINGQIWFSQLYIPASTTLTGACIMAGGGTMTDSWIGYLWNSSGTLVANTALAGTALATASALNCAAFTSTVTVNGPQTYYIGVQGNGTTAGQFYIYGTKALPTNYGTGTQSGVFGTAASITANTTYTAGKGPVMSVY